MKKAPSDLEQMLIGQSSKMTVSSPFSMSISTGESEELTEREKRMKKQMFIGGSIAGVLFLVALAFALRNV